MTSEKGLGHFLKALKVFNIEKRTDSVTFLQLLKFLILKKGLRHCLKVFNTEKWLQHFLRTLKVFNIEKWIHHFLETLKGFNFEKWLHHILMTLKLFQKSYYVECWWTAASEGRLSYHIYLFMINELHLLWVPIS